MLYLTFFYACLSPWQDMAHDADSLRRTDVPVPVGVLRQSGFKLTFYITACVVLCFGFLAKSIDNTPMLCCGCRTEITQGQDLLFS